MRSLGDRAVAVLGNHDLHLICVAAGAQRPGRRDSFEDILDAPDRDTLLAWLRTRPLMHVEGDWALVHAGLLPRWTIAQARALAGEVEAWLAGPDHAALLSAMYGDEPDAWSDHLAPIERARVVINAMTRLRMCDAQGRMALRFKGEPGEAAPAGLMPWFDVPGRASATHVIACGHWSALGLYVTERIAALDSGCVWGRSLSAIRLEDRRVTSVPCGAAAAG